MTAISPAVTGASQQGNNAGAGRSVSVSHGDTLSSIAQRNGGLCVFSARQGQFLLQIMLPVLET